MLLMKNEFPLGTVNKTDNSGELAEIFNTVENGGTWEEIHKALPEIACVFTTLRWKKD